MRNYCFLLLLMFCVACQEQPETENETSVQDSLQFSKPIEVELKRKITLLPQTKEQVSQWLAYAAALHEIESMKEATGYQLIQNSEPLEEIMSNLKTSVPDTLRVPAVQSRISVLLTKASILHQLSTKKEKNIEEIFEAANDIILEFENFQIQLNELFLKTPEDFEFELDQEFEEDNDQDSLVSPMEDNDLVEE